MFCDGCPIAALLPSRRDGFALILSGRASMKRILTVTICALVCTGSLALTSPRAVAQSEAKPERSDVIGNVGRWFDRSVTSIGDYFKSAGKNIDNFNREAGVAAKTTAGAAVDAADAVAKIPKTRVVTGHQSCPLADNGAPDCAAGATKLCQARGMKAGTSLDVTSARDCKLPQRLSQAEAGKRECTDVTFVTRAMCQ
jgi:hypothetical protein